MGMTLTDGFEHYYRRDAQHVRKAFPNAVVVLDTNILLNALRYSPTAREELIRVIETIADQCFIPHQIALEYNRNRVGVVTARLKELEEASSEIDDIQKSIRALVNRLRTRRIIQNDEAERLDESANSLRHGLQDAVDDALTQYDLDPAKLVGKIDPWTERLNAALEGKVAEPPPAKVLDRNRKEAERRGKENLAPGFKDKAGGDYMWWAEVLDLEDLKGKPLVVVSDDAAKGDWRFEQHGISIGPHAILFEDVAKAGGTDLFLLTTRDLLQLSEDLGSAQVSESTIAESEELLIRGPIEWTLEGYISLITLLETEGYRIRAEVIRAAASGDAYLERNDVYQISGMAEAERSLRQFATPVQRLTRRLLYERKVPEGVPEALTAEYDGPGKAIGYSVPGEFVDFERILVAAESAIENEVTTDWNVRDQVRAQMRSTVKRLALSAGKTDDLDRVAELLLDRVESQIERGAPKSGSHMPTDHLSLEP